MTNIRKEQYDFTGVLGLIYPVGSLYFNASSSTNPATLLGFGTWEAFGAGRILVGKAASGTFQTAGDTGGSVEHTLTVDEMPSHTHIQNAHNHGYMSSSSQTSGSYYGRGSTYAGVRNTNTDVGTGSTVTNQNAGSGQAHPNVAPYIVVQIWRRTE